jgi:hypothetical protein
MKKIVPIFLENVSLRVDVALDDSIPEAESLIQLLISIREKLGSLGEGALVEQLTKVLTATTIETITLRDRTVKDEDLGARPEVLDTGKHVMGSANQFQGKQINSLDPEVLFSILDTAPYTFNEADLKAIKDYRQEYRLKYGLKQSQIEKLEVSRVEFQEDEIPF